MRKIIIVVKLTDLFLKFQEVYICNGYGLFVWIQNSMCNKVKVFCCHNLSCYLYIQFWLISSRGQIFNFPFYALYCVQIIINSVRHQSITTNNKYELPSHNLFLVCVPTIHLLQGSVLYISSQKNNFKKPQQKPFNLWTKKCELLHLGDNLN